jgi:hypothetical protein
MKIAIMQPYFLPYVGYFQLISSVDKFVIYDNIKYTKKGWINRNYILNNNNSKKLITIPLVKSSDYANIVEKQISKEFNKDKLLSQIRSFYLRAPYFDDVWEKIRKIILFKDDNLFYYLKNSILEICDYLKIDSEILISSSINSDQDAKAQDKVISICRAMNADEYINLIGGLQLYKKETFFKYRINLNFIKPNKIEYKQFNDLFVPSLSILDLMMFNSKDKCRQIVKFEFNYQ